MKNPSLLAKEFIENGKLQSTFIIDNHTHMGGFYGSSLPNQSVVNMLETMKKNNVKFIISVPNSALFDPLSGNSEIEAMMKLYPKKIYGYYAINPNYPIENIQIEDAFKTNCGYVGFKLLPDYHKTALTSKKYENALNYANQNGLLVMSHTWGQAMDGYSYSNMDMVSEIILKYPKLKFIMGHSAQGECDKAIEVAARFPNAYLELTDTYRLNGIIEKMCKVAGSHKVLFGTDLPWYDPAYSIGCILFSEISDDEKINILNRNSINLLQGIINLD